MAQLNRWANLRMSGFGGAGKVKGNNTRGIFKDAEREKGKMMDKDWNEISLRFEPENKSHSFILWQIVYSKHEGRQGLSLDFSACPSGQLKTKLCHPWPHNIFVPLSPRQLRLLSLHD